MQNKTNSIVIVLLVIIILILGYFTFFKKENPNQNTTVATSNKLFEFLDTFTVNRDMGTPKIEFMYPEEHLMLVSYPTSQETGSYAVYDYKNDILYKEIGVRGYAESAQSEPMAFVGKDKLLVYNSELSKTSVTVVDFNNKLVKTLLTNTPLYYQVYTKYGPEIIIDTDTSATGRFTLNIETLELSPWKYESNHEDY